MNFTQPEFILLFCAFFLFYLAIPHYFVALRHPQFQNVCLIVASYVFYAWFDWRFLALLWFTTFLDYYCGLVIDYARHNGAAINGVNMAKLSLVTSIVSNLLVLGFFKYFDFFVDSAERLVHLFDINLPISVLRVALPAGISFYTFQSMSYVIDIYDGRIRATPRLLSFAAYVSYFPHLVAGPILRATSMLPKIEHGRQPSLDDIYSGLQLALWGYFLKVVIADNMASIVNIIYANPNSHGAHIILATWAFAFQIYCDFLGYTTIARGISRMMGFELPLNFMLPYLARNPTDFWRRWHISLSTWLRDYLYIRLGGNREGSVWTVRNLMITMLLGGLWHGAAWKFVIWGGVPWHAALHSPFAVPEQWRYWLADVGDSPLVSGPAVFSDHVHRLVHFSGGRNG